MPNIATLDLNLLLVLDAIMREGSVVKAARRLGISQPAASHALARLRVALKDELLIRTAGGMVPTERAEQLAQHVRRALDDIETGLRTEPFNPAEASANLTLAMDNYAVAVLSGPLIQDILTFPK